MKQINIHEAKTHLSRYAQRVKAGESILLCDRNRPFAEIRPLVAEEVRTPLRYGVAKGRIEIAEDFDAPLADFEAEFYGE